MRRLVYVPIVHSEADFGSLTRGLRKRYIDRFGLSRWRERVKSVDAFWEEVRGRILALEIDFRKVKIYQDGLPICGKEMDIVRDLARQESKNHLLLVELAERGAEIVGTEDAQLLVEEYLLSREGLEGRGAEARDWVSEGKDLLGRRDRHIAERIKATLGEGETGILFIGLLHKVDEKLGHDVETRHLLMEGEEITAKDKR